MFYIFLNPFWIRIQEVSHDSDPDPKHCFVNIAVCIFWFKKNHVSPVSLKCIPYRSRYLSMFQSGIKLRRCSF